ncbi:hypothetical protein FRC20_005423 [Serendipita sp. 405]|nr:hypothetical protein FRC15_005442 [Serendipita sp. 397]KAG8774176.1 hypothetical protein FRC16_005175 [Serendipita sp. 398]KAG8840773.1 hypothetical protein FRC20_005423 [Serendipita sp. 405]
MPSQTLYIVKIGDEEFRFTQDQLDSEPGNHLAIHFLQGVDSRSNVVEAGNRTLLLERDPLLFKLIQAHLRGYEVLPIPDSLVPGYMTKESALENLQRDARSLGLRRLEEKLMNYQMSLMRGTQIKLPMAQKKYKQAVFKDGNWHIVDISETGFKMLLERVRNGRFEMVVPLRLQCPGYAVVICWDNLDGVQSSKTIALMESID